MIGWKYSKEHLKQQLYIAKVIRAKKVICVCGATIKLSKKWDEDYINRHARSKGCKWDENQKTLYHYFNTPRKHKNDDFDEEWEDWSSEVEDAMDDDDIIGVDECDEEDENSDYCTIDIDIDYDENINSFSNKRRACSGLHSANISTYVDRTPANFSGSYHIEVITKEIWE